jgi:hypothetical protein
MIGSRLAFVPLAALIAAAGGCTGAAHGGIGRAGIQISGLTTANNITSVVVTSGMATASLAFDPAKNKFSGSLALPTGQQTLAVKAFSGDQQVGAGSGTVLITENQTAAVTVRVFDTTGSQAQIDASPYILSLTAASSSPIINQPLALTAVAQDSDGDSIAYMWSASCDGSFSAQAASTTFTPTVTGACKITVTTSDKQLSDSASLDLFVFTPSNSKGAAAVDIDYVQNPQIDYLNLQSYSPTYLSCGVGTYQLDSRCPTPFPYAQVMYVTASYSIYDGETLSFTDNCGGSFQSNVYWYPPSTGGLCKITAKLTNSDGLSSTFSLTAYIKP